MNFAQYVTFKLSYHSASPESTQSNNPMKECHQDKEWQTRHWMRERVVRENKQRTLITDLESFHSVLEATLVVFLDKR